eukprot:CAMPEP_0168862294 /NCGR_PEP_ID=MMETSP0727-20121128/18362_1 /TAXON_ID=265536 /ORGANISM="Amphiprora sp., Strain CCMP467" /LENGTH=316 /DNA_ID=CAMNT_0008917331 /DNA_START=153 /DNA_END=1099 /DNA_ORIENTATION=+
MVAKVMNTPAPHPMVSSTILVTRSSLKKKKMSKKATNCCPKAPLHVSFATKAKVHTITPLMFQKGATKEDLYYTAQETAGLRQVFMEDARRVARRSKCLDDNALYLTFSECSKGECDVPAHLVEELRVYLHNHEHADTCMPQEQQQQQDDSYTGLERMAARQIYADKKFRRATLWESVDGIQKRHAKLRSSYERVSSAMRFACEAISFSSVLFAHQLACAALEKDEYEHVMCPHKSNKKKQKKSKSAEQCYALDLENDGDNEEEDDSTETTVASSTASSTTSSFAQQHRHRFPTHEELDAVDCESDCDDDDDDDES